MIKPDDDNVETAVTLVVDAVYVPYAFEPTWAKLTFRTPLSSFTTLIFSAKFYKGSEIIRLNVYVAEGNFKPSAKDFNRLLELINEQKSSIYGQV